MTNAMESLIATRKFARVLGDETDGTELSLEAREALSAFKVFVERALDQNVFELLTPEALETLKEVLLVACEYDFEVEYPATIVPTGGTPAQKTARRTWIIGWLEGLMTATSTATAVSYPQALAKIPKCRPTGRDARGRPNRRYTTADVMRLKLAVKRIASRFSAEERAAANPKELLKIVRNLIWLDVTRQYLDMSKPAVDEDDEDAEFVDSYEQLLDRFAKLVCQADRLQVMSDAVSVKKRKRSLCGSTEEKKTPMADEEKEKPTADEESDEESEGSDADPRHKPSEKKKSEKPVWRRCDNDQPMWQGQSGRRCFSCGQLGHEARDCGKGKGKGKGFDGRDRYGDGKGRPFWHDGKGFGKGFGKGDKGKPGPSGG